MNIKIATIQLVAPSCNMKAEYEFTHAERILRHQQQPGRKALWELPETSRYEFDGTYLRLKAKNNADKRTGKRTNKKSEK